MADSRSVAVVAGANIHYYTPGPAGLVFSGGSYPPGHCDPLKNLDNLAAYCEALDIRAVWLLAGQQLGPTDTAEWWEVARPRHAATSSPAGITIPTVARLRRHFKDTGRPIYVYDLGERNQRHGASTRTYRDTRWPWWNTIDADAVADAIFDTERALKRTLGTSPGAIGLELMATTNRKHPHYLDYQTPDLTAPRDTAPRWCGYDYDLPHGGAWLHLIDTNAAYLAAAQSTPLGCRGLDYSEVHEPGSKPGIYQVTGNPTGPVITRPGWYDMATIRAARMMGQRIDEAPAWIWQESHAALRTWANDLWSARAATMGLAREAVKSIYTASLGLLGSTSTRGGWYRPLWASAIVAEAGRRQWANVWKLREQGVAVVLVDVDTIGILTTTEKCPMVFDSFLRDGLGGYKPAGSHAVTPAMHRALRAGQLVALKALMGVEEAE